ncbi:unnamed protein product [Psylliodes chrysocephalus]|uniref:non-specific serine/threonine protein kinase n=1 Tax=Psylliodes chrysocephalus TaxID=3402493 RepID=A0A9P0CS69_9CUCU|nr:unnamed protein product [Psylliodes chrysocephala]
MDQSLEIRKLLPSQIRELASILETHELWKRLMTIIPKTLDKYDFQCDITAHNHPKYNSEHFRLIESESEKSRRTCTEILFDEWGTSGRNRPALGHLLHLLTKANLFRAADYVAVDLLHQEKPKRPDIGPEAEIPVNLSDIIKTSDDEFEKVLDDIDYVSDAVKLIRTYSDKTAKVLNKIPQIVITPDIDENINIPKFSVPVVVQKTKSTEEVSDMMKFSTTQIKSSEIPVCVNEISTNNFNSQTNNNVEDNNINTQDLNMPNLSLILGKGTVAVTEETGECISESTVFSSKSTVSNSESTMSSSESNCDTSQISDSNCESSQISESTTNPISAVSDNNPAFSQIMEQPVTVNTNVPNLSILNLEPKVVLTQSQINSEEHIPNLSILNFEPKMLSEEQNLSIQESSVISESNMIPDLDVLQQQSDEITEDSGNLPDLSALQISNLNLNLGSITFSNASQASSENSKTRSCSSPLPNLSLDTMLPHFSYQILELATNSFNTDLYRNEDLNGRLLGKGEFGSVFLAPNLLGKPVAVKKLDIGDVEIVNVDDEVTKQFRNEVEVLSKYKHENLLSLLGYSCDGCTYCLLYEYMPGGALRDRLQDVNNQLLWKERLNVAIGTSKAISYLHTAFSSPLIHRDINSANILLDSNNQPKLGDFGLIKLIPNQNINTATTVFGTSAYMPREAFGGDISVKLDTFSFGVVLLELLTSLPPIDNNRDGADLVTHIGETIENDEIASIIDYKAGSWIENAVNYAATLYKISQSCLEEKKKRPTMLEVKMVLEQMFGELQ